jgi:hypothetical protein
MHRLDFAKRRAECRVQARVFLFRPPPVHLGTSALQPVLVSSHLHHPFPIPFSSSAEHMPSLINILLLTRYHRRRTFLTRLPTCFRYFVRTSAAAIISRTFPSQHRRAWVALPFLKQSLQLTVYSQGKPISKLEIHVTSQHHYSTLRLLKWQAACFRLGDLVTTFRFPSIFQSFASD